MNAPNSKVDVFSGFAAALFSAGVGTTRLCADSIPASSQTYQVLYRTMNGGGGGSSSVHYVADTTTEGSGGVQLGADGLQFSEGYVGEIHDPPVAVPDLVVWVGGSRVQFPWVSLLANDAGADGAGVAVMAVDGLSAAGASLSLMPTAVNYQPSEGKEGSDSFWYQLIDDFGCTASAFVNVLPDGVFDAPPTLGLTIRDDGGRLLNLDGLPNFIYQIQGSADLSNWSSFGDIRADSTGFFQIVDDGADPRGVRFYRSVSP